MAEEMAVDPKVSAEEKDSGEAKKEDKPNTYILEVEKLLAGGKGVGTAELVESLLAVEKSARLAGDMPGVRRAALAVVDVCHERSEWGMLNENIVVLAKRRAQLKQAVSAMVTRAMEWIEGAPNEEEKEKLIRTLLAVTAGKIFVEVERARLTRILATMKEGAGQLGEAAEVMQDVAVETFGAMAKTEKISFILEQVRLCLDKGDFIRAHILAKKIAPRALTSEEVVRDSTNVTGDYHVVPPAEGTPPLSELRILYYELMIRYHAHHNNYLDICRCYQAIAEDADVKASSERWIPVLKKICWFVVLAPYGSDQNSMLHSTSKDKRLDDLPLYMNLLSKFTTQEVIGWASLEAECSAEMAQVPEIFGEGNDGEKRKKDLRQRTVEHNIIVVSKYYSTMTFARLGQLLDLDVDAAEQSISEMVVSKTIQAKLDRPAGVITFTGNGNSDDILNAWSGTINRLLDLVERGCHRLHKDIASVEA